MSRLVIVPNNMALFAETNPTTGDRVEVIRDLRAGEWLAVRGTDDVPRR